MRMLQDTIEVRTPGRGMIDVTDQVKKIVRASSISDGLCVVYCQHTSASLVIQENADPSARHDLESWLVRLAPDGDPQYTHTAEGPDDCPAHLRSAVTKTSESIPLSHGKLALGTWQGIFLAEHRLRPHTRTLIVHIHGS